LKLQNIQHVNEKAVTTHPKGITLCNINNMTERPTTSSELLQE